MLRLSSLTVFFCLPIFEFGVIFAEEPANPPADGQTTEHGIDISRAQARRIQSLNNCKQIGLGLLTYDLENKHLPARAKFSLDKKPLLSWRVLILPYIDETNLYKQFNLDEPWDSEHNKQLLKKMPAAYKDSQIKYESGKTVYEAVVGPGLAFEGSTPLKLSDLLDGASYTIAVVEVAPEKAVPWTKPEDWEVDLKEPLKGLADVQPFGAFQTVFFDGHVEAIKRTIDPDLLKAMFTRNGGESVDLMQVPQP